MKHTAAIAHFRQMCCLNINPQILMPALLQHLHELIGSDSNAFYWSNRPGRVTNAYSEEPMPRDIAVLFYDEFLNNSKRPDAAIHLGTLMRPGQVVGNSIRMFPSAFYQTDNYNLIWRPLRRKALLWARMQDQHGNFHCITLRRLIRESSFSDQDEQRLAQLVPYLAHALNAGEKCQDEWVDNGDSGMIIADHQGVVRYHSDQAQRLLLLAAHPTISTGTVDWSHDALPMQLKLLCARMGAIAAGRDATPPRVMIENAWGKFVFRTHFLNASDNAGALLGITIRHHVPLALQLMTRMKALELSARQKQVCLLLARRQSHGTIAAQLGVSSTTIADHVHKLYDKFGVHSHNELMNRLSKDEIPSQHH